jgi:PadR family transcriptional regulator, regulatory protein AphA
MFNYIYAYTLKEKIMSLPHALLGLISYQPSTGYELRTVFSESVQFFWSATLPQIYRTLNQMESRGWLTVKVEPQEGKPSRKVYSITDEGAKELKRWLESQPEIPPERNPFLLKIFFGRMTNADSLIKIIVGCQEYHKKLSEQYDTKTVSSIEHYAEACSSPGDEAFWKLTLNFGQRHSNMVVDWCDHAIKTIKQINASLPINKQKTTPTQGGTQHGTPRGVRKSKKTG